MQHDTPRSDRGPGDPQIASDEGHPPDICLLLRAHGEQRWLTSEVLPMLADLERPGAVQEEHLGAALAYLEVLWLDARRRARETDIAHRVLFAIGATDAALYESARRYHASVLALRTSTEARVRALLRCPECTGTREHATG
jgi:hypothetical protein